AYRALAMKYHPDRNSGDETAAVHFKEAAEAYDVLGDPDKRARYDRYGHAGLEGLPLHDFSNVASIFDSLGDILVGFFGDRGIAVMNQGIFRNQQTCRCCGGRGWIITDLCPACKGRGRVKTKRTLQVQVPAGVDNGERQLSPLRGEGNAGELGAPRGDLYF